MIGREGIDAVSLRQIAAEVGQSNPAAVQYHFGDREGLLDAIYRYRLDHLDRVRAKLMADADPAALRDPRRLLEFLALPVACIVNARGSYSYARFMVRMEHALGGPVSSSRVRDYGATMQVIGLLKDALGEIPPDIADIKITLSMRLAMIALISVEDRRMQPWGSVEDEEAIAVGLDIAAAGLGCRVSDPALVRSRLKEARQISAGLLVPAA